MPPRQLCGLRRVPGQQPEERFDPLRIEREPLRELPQDRPQRRAHGQRSRGKEIRQRRLRIGQLQHVREVARTLDRKHEPLRHRLGPLPERRRRLHPIEGAVDFERIELPRRKLQLPLLRHALGIEIPPPRPVGPPRNPDPDITVIGQSAPSLLRGKRNSSGLVAAPDLSSPLPLEGRVRVGVSSPRHTQTASACSAADTPTLDPSPQGGGRR